MDDDVGLRGCDRLRKRVAVENVNHDWHNPQRAQHPVFGGCARRAGNLMHGFVQQTGEPSPDDTRRTCQENSHFAPR
jgi:hypothetical protein